MSSHCANTTEERMYKVWDDKGNEATFWSWYPSTAMQSFAEKFSTKEGEYLRYEECTDAGIRYRYLGPKTGYR